MYYRRDFYTIEGSLCTTEETSVLQTRLPVLQKRLLYCIGDWVSATRKGSWVFAKRKDPGCLRSEGILGGCKAKGSWVAATRSYLFLTVSARCARPVTRGRGSWGGPTALPPPLPRPPPSLPTSHPRRPHLPPTDIQGCRAWRRVRRGRRWGRKRGGG